MAPPLQGGGQRGAQVCPALVSAVHTALRQREPARGVASGCALQTQRAETATPVCAASSSHGDLSLPGWVPGGRPLPCRPAGLVRHRPPVLPCPRHRRRRQKCGIVGERARNADENTLNINPTLSMDGETETSGNPGHTIEWRDRGFGVRVFLALSSCVTLGTFLDLSEPPVLGCGEGQPWSCLGSCQRSVCLHTRG